jgi:hypothetical protein
VPLFGDSLRSATPPVLLSPRAPVATPIQFASDSDAHSLSKPEAARVPTLHAQCGIMPNSASYSYHYYDIIHIVLLRAHAALGQYGPALPTVASSFLLGAYS